MKRFMLMHFGFEKPGPEVMQAWQDWFAKVGDRTVENVGLGAAREISADGTREIEWGTESITGITILQAESLDEATKLAEGNPFVRSIRICEVREHG